MNNDTITVALAALAGAILGGMIYSSFSQNDIPTVTCREKLSGVNRCIYGTMCPTDMDFVKKGCN